MKIAYIYKSKFWIPDGVSLKISDQCKTWRELGHEVSEFCFVSKRDFKEFSNISNVNQFRKIIAIPNNEIAQVFQNKNSSLDLLDQFQPDIVYLRYMPFRLFLRKIFKYKFALEINSDDIDEYRNFAKSSIKGFFLFVWNYFTRHLLLSRAACLISVTHEIATRTRFKKYNQNIFVVPNSIDLKKKPLLKTSGNNRSGTAPRLFFVGSPGFNWHGIDKLIDFAKTVVGKLEFYMIGGHALEDQKLPPNLKVFPHLDSKELESVIADCDIAIATLALHRKNLNEACPLKTRDYLAYGFPIILAYMDTAFFDIPTPPFILNLENIENNLHPKKSEILAYSKKFQNFVVNRDQIESLIDSTKLEKDRLDYLSNFVR